MIDKWCVLALELCFSVNLRHRGHWPLQMLLGIFSPWTSPVSLASCGWFGTSRWDNAMKAESIRMAWLRARGLSGYRIRSSWITYDKIKCLLALLIYKLSSIGLWTLSSWWYTDRWLFKTWDSLRVFVRWWTVMIYSFFFSLSRLLGHLVMRCRYLMASGWATGSISAA